MMISYDFLDHYLYLFLSGIAGEKFISKQVDNKKKKKLKKVEDKILGWGRLSGTSVIKNINGVRSLNEKSDIFLPWIWLLSMNI